MSKFRKVWRKSWHNSWRKSWRTFWRDRTSWLHGIWNHQSRQFCLKGAFHPASVIRASLITSIVSSIVSLGWTSAAPGLAAPIRPETACPTDATILSAMLLRDLPGYTNRVQTRLVQPFLAAGERPTTIIIASEAELAPLSLGPGIYRPVEPEATVDNVEQIFFTTLERQHLGDDWTDLQQFYWLFLARTDDRWWLSQLFTSIGSYPDGDPPTPPQNATYGAIAQAIRLWLKDCEAGAVYPLEPEDLLIYGPGDVEDGLFDVEPPYSVDGELDFDEFEF
jgi:hypothetical protein